MQLQQAESLRSTASHWEKDQIERTVNSLIYFCDIRWIHACLWLCGGGWQWNKIRALIGAHLLMELFENHGPGGHGEDEPWRWHHSPERNNKRRLVLVKTKDVCLRRFFPLSRFVLWAENVTTQYTDLCFSGNRLSLCRSAEDWRWGGEAESGPLVLSADHMSG